MKLIFWRTGLIASSGRDAGADRERLCPSTMTKNAKLLSATAIERMAVVTGVTVVPNARMAGVALTGLDGYKAVGAMSKTLKHDGSTCILRKQKGGRANKHDEPLFHTFPRASTRSLY